MENLIPSDTDVESDDDGTYGVLDMLNCRVISNDPSGDSDRYPSCIPTEENAIEYCRTQKIINELLETNKKLEEKLSQREDELKNEKQKSVDKEKQVEDATKRAEEAKEHMKRCLFQISQLSIHLSSKDIEMSEMKTQLQETKKENEKFQKIISDRDQEIAEYRKEISEVRKELEGNQKISSELQADIKLKTEEMEALQNDLEKCKEKLSSMEARLSEMEAVAEEQREKFDLVFEEKNNLTKKVDDLEVVSSKQKENIEDLKKLLEEEQKMRVALETKCEKSGKILSSLNSSLDLISVITEELKVSMGVKELTDSGLNNETCNLMISQWDMLPLNIKTKLQLWQENQKLDEKETAMKNTVETLLQVLTRKSREEPPVSIRETPVEQVSYSPGQEDPSPTNPMSAASGTPLLGISYRDALKSSFTSRSSSMPESRNSWSRIVAAGSTPDLNESDSVGNRADKNPRFEIKKSQWRCSKNVSESLPSSVGMRAYVKPLERNTVAFRNDHREPGDSSAGVEWLWTHTTSSSFSPDNHGNETFGNQELQTPEFPQNP